MEAEAAFRIHKSDLDLRRLWRQKQERVEVALPTRSGVTICK